MKKVSFFGVFDPAVANMTVPYFNDREWLESVARGGGTLRHEGRKCQKCLDSMTCHEGRTHTLKSSVHSGR